MKGVKEIKTIKIFPDKRKLKKFRELVKTMLNKC